MPPRAVRGWRMTALPEPRTVRADGAVVAVRDSGGSGPALALLHGLGGASESWVFQFGAFGAGYRVIAWDMPGYGLSGNLASRAPSAFDTRTSSPARSTASAWRARTWSGSPWPR